MAMPPQLARANRRRHRTPRPVVELLPNICISDLCRWKVFPDNYYSRHTLTLPFKYPFAKSLVISRQSVEINHHLGYIQRIGIHWLRTGFGRPRPLFICDQCCGGVTRLFFKSGHLACRYCLKALYASQKHNQIARKRLAASKLRLSLGGLPNINEPIAPKAKGKHRKRYQYIRNEIQALEAKLKHIPFRTQLPTQCCSPRTTGHGQGLA